jgi:hypothetical protein
MKIFFLTIFFTSINFCFAQDEKYQPDSIYANRKVREIKIFMNSPKDLSRIIHLNENGQRLKVENFSASNDKKSRKFKGLQSVSFYNYNDQNKLIKIVDSSSYYENYHEISYEIGNTVFEYDKDGFLKSEKYFKSDNLESYRQINYSYLPYKTNLIVKNDTIVTLNWITEYDKNFYVSREYGFSFQPKVEYITVIENGKEFKVSHDYLERHETDLYYNNKFDEDGKRVSSDLINKGHNVYKLEYKYFSNGLLKSERGYVPIYFEYVYFN